MRDDHTIVVGMDATPGSAEALAWGIREAARRRWGLHLVHGLPDVGLDAERRGRDPEVEDKENRLAAEDLLAAAASRASDAGVHDVRSTVSARPPGPLLIEASRDAALLVVGARPHGARLGRRGDSTSAHVARFARCPVVVTGAPNGRTGLIAVHVHGNAADGPALNFAFEHAVTSHSEVEVVHAWREPDPGPLDFSVLADDRVEVHRRASEVMLGELLAGFAASYPDVPVQRVSLPADPRDALLWSSAQADLLVLAAPDPSSEGMSAELLEMTALRHSHCPVVFAR